VALFVDGVRLDEEVVWTRFGDVTRLEELHFVDEMTDVDIPSAFWLYQNRPNPFNPRTTIRYDVAEAGLVRVNVYAVTGQHIRTLVDEEHPAGNYSVAWDGTTHTSRDVASGVYLCRMVCGKFNAVRKLALVR